jgi:hypothetical protein
MGATLTSPPGPHPPPPMAPARRGLRLTLPLFTTSSLKQAFAALRSDLLHETARRSARCATTASPSSPTTPAGVRAAPERSATWPRTCARAAGSCSRYPCRACSSSACVPGRRVGQARDRDGAPHQQDRQGPRPHLPQVEDHAVDRGPDGLAADCARVITDHTERHPTRSIAPSR